MTERFLVAAAVVLAASLLFLSGLAGLASQPGTATADASEAASP